MKALAYFVGKPIVLDLQCSMEDGVTYPGNNIPDIPNPVVNVATAAACCDLCKQNPLCKLFTWIVDKSRCFLKQSKGDPSYNVNRVSGTTGTLFLNGG